MQLQFLEPGKSKEIASEELPEGSAWKASRFSEPGL
jgi:hypothetical protein